MKQLLRGGEAAFLFPDVLMLPSGMCGQQEESRNKKSAIVLYDELRHFLCVVCIYLSDCLFGCKEQ
jgi:hypothetical protein